MEHDASNGVAQLSKYIRQTTKCLKQKDCSITKLKALPAEFLVLNLVPLQVRLYAFSIELTEHFVTQHLR